jgi:hypothetical protein
MDYSSGTASGGTQPAPQGEAQPAPQGEAQQHTNGTDYSTFSTDELLFRAGSVGRGESEDIARELQGRSYIRMTGQQLASFSNATIVKALMNSPNPSHRAALLAASDEIAKNPDLGRSMNGEVKRLINTLRASRSDTMDSAARNPI